MRSTVALALAAAIVLAGCSAPAATDRSTGTPSVTGPAATTTGPSTSGPTTTRPSRSTDANESPPSDPDVDVRGWENGYWYDEALDLTPGDGYGESELAALVARAMARIERIRDVEFERDVEVTVVSRSELDTGGGKGGGASGEPTMRAVTYRALFLIGDRADAGRQRNRTRRASVRGYYSVRRDEIVVVSPTETPRIGELTLAHELVHAYQFRHRSFSLPRSPSDEAIEALVAVIEGEASFVEHRYARRCRTNWSCAGPGGAGVEAAGNGSTDGGPDVHMGLYLLQYFPYSEGEELVARAYRRGGWDAVADLYASPPRTTAAVIHPGRTVDPAEVRVPDRSIDAWRRLTASRGRRSVVVGEDGLATMFMYTAYDDRPGTVVDRDRFLVRDDGTLDPVNPLDYGLNYTAGWAGDALAGYANGTATAYVWRLRWANDSEAREFLRGYRRLLRYRGGERVASDAGAGYWRLDGPFAGAYYVARSGRTVTIVHAPTVAALGAVWGPAARNGTDARHAPVHSGAARDSDATAGSVAENQPATGRDVRTRERRTRPQSAG